MMLITILLMIEDRRNTSFAKKMLSMYIYNLLSVMKTGAKQTRSFTLNGNYNFYNLSVFILMKGQNIGGEIRGKINRQAHYITNILLGRCSFLRNRSVDLICI